MTGTVSRAVLLVGLALLTAGCVTAQDPNDRTPAAPPTEVGLDGSLRLANAALRGGDVNSGINLLRQATTENPGSVPAQRALADAYYSIGAMPEAALAYRDLGGMQPGDPHYLIGLGRVALAGADYGEAQRRFAAARQVVGDDPKILNGLAVAYDLAGQHGQAQRLYQQVLQLDPANRAAANNLALSLLLAGQTDVAIDQMTDLAYGPAVLPQARHNLALAYALAGNEDAARDLVRGDLPRNALEENIAFYRTVRASRGG